MKTKNDMEVTQHIREHLYIQIKRKRENEVPHDSAALTANLNDNCKDNEESKDENLPKKTLQQIKAPLMDQTDKAFSE